MSDTTRSVTRSPLSSARLSSLALLLLLLATQKVAQTQEATPPPTKPKPIPQKPGSVSGRLLARATNLPIRLGSVQLLRAKAEPGADEDNGRAGQQIGYVMTGLDGTFSFNSVPPGDYFLTAEARGYVDPRTKLLVASGDQQLKGLLAISPQLHVAAGKESRADVALDTGATISGTVRFDDGSPAADVDVKLDPEEAVNNPKLLGTLFSRFTQRIASSTDERGVYRIAGVPPGKFLVEVRVPANGNVANVADDRQLSDTRRPLTLYAPHAVLASDAQRVEIKGTEEVQGVDITLDLDGLHTIQGHVQALTDGHGLNRATITLTTAADPVFKREVHVADSGEFAIDFVPAGTYHLGITAAADSEDVEQPGERYETPKLRLLRQYFAQTFELSVTNADLEDQDFKLKEDKTRKPGEIVEQ